MTTSTASPSGTARAAAATSRAWRLGSTCGRTRRSHAAKNETRAGPDVQRRGLSSTTALKTYKTFTFTFEAFDGVG